MSSRFARFALAAALLLSGALLRHSSAPAGHAPKPTAASAPRPEPAATTARTASTPEQPAPHAAPDASAETLPQGITGVWHCRFDAPLSSLAPTDARDFTPPVDLVLPVSSGERVIVRLRRFDVTGPEAGVFTGDVPGHPGATVVLSYVGAAQAGVVYLPDESRSFVINGGDDGRVRITATDLTRAPGCAPEPPRPTPL